jgi:hypothetical protein
MTGWYFCRAQAIRVPSRSVILMVTARLMLILCNEVAERRLNRICPMLLRSAAAGRSLRLIRQMYSGVAGMLLSHSITMPTEPMVFSSVMVADEEAPFSI